MHATPFPMAVIWLTLLPMIAMVISLVITILVIIAIFQIKSATRRTAERLDDIYELLKERKNQ